MKKIVFLILIGMNLLASQKNISDKKLESLISDAYKIKLPDSNTNLGNVIDNMDKGEDGTFMGRKLATMRFPTRTVETIEDPLKRAELANINAINNHSYEIAKKSENVAKLYKFLSLYGIKPRKNGTLENEKELYKLIESGEIKLTSRLVKEQPKKITPVNHFKILSK